MEQKKMVKKGNNFKNKSETKTYNPKATAL